MEIDRLIIFKYQLRYLCFNTYIFSGGLNASQRQNLGETKARKASEELKRKMSQSLGGSDQAPESEPSSKRKSSDDEDLSRLVACHHMLSER